MKKKYISPTSEMLSLCSESHLMAGSAGGGSTDMGVSDDFTSSPRSNHVIWNSDSWTTSAPEE